MSRASRIDSSAAQPKRPPLIIDAGHYHRLAGLVLGEEVGAIARQLLDEIERAELKRSEDVPADVVTIGAEVTYADGRSGKRETIRLSFPQEAEIRERRVSVLTPIGAALLGLSVGQSIEWTMPDGSTRELTVLSVAQPRRPDLPVQAA